MNSTLLAFIEHSAEYMFLSKTPRTFTKIDIFWAIKDVSINVKGLKSYRVRSATTIEFNEKSLTEASLEYPKYENEITYLEKPSGHKRNPDAN